MLTIIFVLLMFAIFGKIAMFGLKATWGIAKFLVTVVLLPVILIGMVIAGLITFALPILVIIGIYVIAKMVFD